MNSPSRDENPRPEDPYPGLPQGGETPRKSSADLRTHAALLLVQMAFASQPVEAKVAMRAVADGGEGVPPESIAMVRMLGAAAFFHVFGLVSRRGRAEAPLTRRDHAELAVLSLFGIVMNIALYLVGLRTTAAVPAALLSVTIPVTTAALAIVFRKEAPNVRSLLGLAVAVAGVLWLTGVRGVDRGVFILVGNSLFYATYVVFSRDVIRRLGSVRVVTWLFTWGALAFAPVGLPSVVRNAPSWSSRAWGLVAFIVVVPTIVAYLAHAWALARSTPSVVTVYVCIQPILTALLAWVQFGDGLSLRMVEAGALILVGVAVVATRPATAPAKPLPEAPTRA
ncbi:MAG: DMT family transporter [Polyangiaceae bacterium]